MQLAMKYSTVHKAGNVASDSLVGFAYNNTRQHFLKSLDSVIGHPRVFSVMVHMLNTLKTPAVFMYYLAAGPLLYKAGPNSKSGGLEGKL